MSLQSVLFLSTLSPCRDNCPVTASGRKRRTDRHVAVALPHLGLLGHFKCVVHFDAKISNGALKLGVTEKYLYRSDVFRSRIDQRRFGPTHRMSAIWHWVEADGGYPGFHYA